MARSIVGHILGEGMEARNARQLERPPHVEVLHLAINAFLEHLEHGDAVHAGAYEAYETGSAQGGEQAKQAFFAALANSDHPPHSRLPVLSQFLLNEWNFVRRPIPEVPAYRFLGSLPSVADGMLAPEDAVCAICFQSYGTSASGEEDDESYAVKLPCCSQHIGLDCIETWLDPFDEPARNDCPFCRAECFPLQPPTDTIEGIQNMMDAYSHRFSDGVPAFSDDDVQSITEWRVELLGGYIEQAVREVQDAIDVVSPQYSPLLAQCILAEDYEAARMASVQCAMTDETRFILQEMFLRKTMLHYWQKINYDTEKSINEERGPEELLGFLQTRGDGQAEKVSVRDSMAEARLIMRPGLDTRDLLLEIVGEQRRELDPFADSETLSGELG
ncbi:MAG: hypothetical protein OHK93_006260 [Ramalina farinacea]|uniref:RING-type domain-containing protein n=1 Tax=Ramalina farinacea TaxID=258253 RepID=A0AA43QLP2_9LECA|nr:hypothetical protein [Ramalina farinacea]